MARRKDQLAISGAVGCEKCHADPLKRTIHLLRMMDQGADQKRIRDHLLLEFGEKQEKDGFIKSELIHLEFIRSHYGSKDTPAWIDWVEANGATVFRHSKGWRIVPKRRDITASEIRRNVIKSGW